MYPLALIAAPAARLHLPHDCAASVRASKRVSMCLLTSPPAACSASPERERPGLPLSPSKRRAGGGSVSSGGGEKANGSPTKRGGSGRGGMFRTRSSGAAADPGALPAALATGLIAPPLPRADWPLVTPVAILK